MCLGWCLGSITFGIIGTSINLFGKLIPWGPASTGKYFTTILFLLVLLSTCFFLESVPIKFLAWPKTIVGASEEVWRGVARMRVFLALFSYHLLLAACLVKVEDSEDGRAIIQNGLWPIKILFLAALIIGSFLVPLPLLNVFVKIAWGLAFLYLIIQGVLFIDLIYKEAEKVVDRLERAESNFLLYAHVLFVIFLYLSSLALMVLATVVQYSHSFKIVAFGWFQVFLQVILLLLSLSKPIQEANEQAGIYQSGLTCIYTTFLLHSAFKSVDSGADYNGTFFLVITLVYAAYNVGLSSRQLLDLEKESRESEELIHYNMSFFNLIFAMAAAYAMLVLTNWSDIDVQPHNIIPGVQRLHLEKHLGMAFYSKVFSSFSMSLLYTWSLIAPIILPNRDFF